MLFEPKHRVLVIPQGSYYFSCIRAQFITIKDGIFDSDPEELKDLATGTARLLSAGPRFALARISLDSRLMET